VGSSPGEQFLGAALEHDPRLIEDGFLRSVAWPLRDAHGAPAGGGLRWRQERLTEHARKPGGWEGSYERMAVLTEHLNDVGQALGRASSRTTRRRVARNQNLPAARRFKSWASLGERFPG